MLRLIKVLVWVFLFGVACLAMDQFFVQVDSMHPAHATARDFYLDFRKRLIATFVDAGKAPMESIEAVIDKQQKTVRNMSPGIVGKSEIPDAVTLPQASPESQRYIYSDQNGELHFADSLDEVPKDLRPQAQPIGQ